MLEIRPITLRDANRFVAEHHRHNMPTTGHKYSIACYDGNRLCGVAIAGKPVARKLDDGLTIEIRRVCTDGTRNACSILYGACSRCAKEMGYKRVITYTLVSENGASLRASGFIQKCIGGGYIVEYAEQTERGNATDAVWRGAQVPGRVKNQMGEGVQVTLRDLLMIWTGMVLYRIVYEYIRLKRKAGV
jgi:hypothetical protein